MIKNRPARKRFGQHFLIDPVVIDRILAAVRVQAGQRVVEIGPGQGVLTRPLLQRLGHLDVVELDRDLAAELPLRCRGLQGLQVYNADALAFDFAALRNQGAALRIVGNLPYNISTPLLFHLLDGIEHLIDMHFMLQKEVVERMAAAPSTPAYGRLSVMLQYRCRIEPLFTVGSEAFAPPPRVESAFARLIPHSVKPFNVRDESHFAALVRQAFSQRRKTLRKSLGGILTAADMLAVGVDPGLRPETLTPAQFAALSDFASLH